MEPSESRQERQSVIKHIVGFLVAFGVYAVAHDYALRLPLVFDIWLLLAAITAFAILMVVFHAQLHEGVRPDRRNMARIIASATGIGLTGFLVGRTSWFMAPMVIIQAYMAVLLLRNPSEPDEDE